jgi:hypothetical protein
MRFVTLGDTRLCRGDRKCVASPLLPRKWRWDLWALAVVLGLEVEMRWFQHRMESKRSTLCLPPAISKCQRNW